MINKIKKLQKLKKKDVYIFCAGKNGMRIANELKRNDVFIKGFLDNDKNKQGEKIDGIDVLNPDAIHNSIIIIATKSVTIQNEIKEQIKDNILIEDIYTLEEIYTRISYSGEILSIPRYENPDVSICLTLYNGWPYTYNCIESFLDCKTAVPYEFIIGDNCSEDETSKIEKYVIGAKVFHNIKNLGYLRNVNETLKRASSSFVLILQNDTLFLEDYWLDIIYEYIYENDDCCVISPYMCGYDRISGMGGWRLSEDGTLTCFSDRLCSEPYSVAYVQPAAVLIRKSVWDALGGFDDVFSPAWCEDLDLFIRMLKEGYDIVMHPRTSYVHYGSKTCVIQNDIYNEHYRIVKQRYRGEFKKLQLMIDNRNYMRGICDESMM